MRTVRINAPDGTAWSVRVVWEPRWHALARRFGGWRRRRRNGRGKDSDVDGSGQYGDGGVDHDGPANGGGSSTGSSSSAGGFWEDIGDEIMVGVAVVIAMIVFGFVFWFLLLPVLLLLVDIVVVIILMAVAIPARVLFRRPWTVRATAEGPARASVSVDVVGWRQALRTRDDMAVRLAAGLPALPVASYSAVADI